MKNLALCAIMLLTVCGALSQEQDPRPKVGLVLSGGGAKGFAHIGVLKVLEEAGVKIDFIGGTSMGAIVGGLYASGYNATQIDSIFHVTDFDALLQDFVPRSSKNFYGKRNDEVYALSLPFHKFKVGIPSAYSKGLYNYNLLTRLTHNVRHVTDFKKLPIPFLCIATDIETGEEVLLDHGYLPQAMAASAAFPSLFSPVEIDGRVLVDGGITNNYPIEEIKSWGADFIIGVDVQDDLRDRAALRDATKILVQISNLQMIERMAENKKITNIYIKPDIKDFGVISFDAGRDIIKKGEEAARTVYDQIEKLAELQKYKRPDLQMSIDSLTIDAINLPKLTNYTRSYVIGKLRFRPDEKISYKELKQGIDNLSATKTFSTIGYSLTKSAKGGDELNLNLLENPVRTFLKFGVHYDGLYKTAILTNITHSNLFYRNDVVSLDVILGDNFRYNFDYYIDNGFYFSFGFKSRYNRFNQNVGTDFNQGEVLDDINLRTINLNFSDLTNQAYVQTIFADKFLTGVGVELKQLRITSETIEEQNQVFDNSSYFSGFGYIRYDSFDNKYFPKKGWYFLGDFQTYLASTDYTREFERYSIAKADAGIAYTFYNKFTLKLQSEIGFAIGPKSVPFFDFILGGYGFNPINNIRPFYGYDFLSLSGDSYIKSSATADYEIFRKHHVNFSVNAASIGEGIFKTPEWLTNKRKTGYAVGYGIDTAIGPLEVKYTWSPELPDGFVWFSIGFWF
jgi:NTE family protein